MKTNSTSEPTVTIGVDVSDKSSEIYVIDRQGEWVESLRVPTKADALSSALTRYRDARVVIEVGPHSPWISRLLSADGFDVVVANPRRVRPVVLAQTRFRWKPAQELVTQERPLITAILSGGTVGRHLQVAHGAARERHQS